jgi:hypothetical protein
MMIPGIRPAERSGRGKGDRVSTISVQCADNAESNSTGTVDVTVPHDRRNRRETTTLQFN